MLREKVTQQLATQRQRRIEGKLNAIPFPLKRFSTVLPGIEQGRYYNVTAQSKVGKTQLADFLFVYSPLEYLMQNPDAGLKLKIDYFSLEMSKESKMMQLMSYFLFKKKGIILSPTKLESKYEYVLEEEILKFFDEERDFFDFFEKHVRIIDNIKNPFGMYKEIRRHYHTHGHYVDKNGNKLDTRKIELGIDDEYLKVHHYVPDDDELYYESVYDHIGLISPEKGYTLHQAMSKFSSDYLVSARNKWNHTPVVVQQQALEGEKQQFTNSGRSIIAKLRPSPDMLGDNKLIGRDCNYMLGLFAPNRYDIPEYAGYDLTRLKDSHRELSVIYSRHSASSQAVNLMFLGACNYFAELKPEFTDVDYATVAKFQQMMKS